MALLGRKHLLPAWLLTVASAENHLSKLARLMNHISSIHTEVGSSYWHVLYLPYSLTRLSADSDMIGTICTLCSPIRCIQNSVALRRTELFHSTTFAVNRSSTSPHNPFNSTSELATLIYHFTFTITINVMYSIHTFQLVLILSSSPKAWTI